MTVKHCQIGKIYNAVKNISSQRIPAEKAYKIFRLKKDLRELLEFAVAEEAKLFDKYKVKVKNGNIEADDIGVIEKLNEELKELCNTEIELDFERIKFEEKDFENIKMSADEFEALEGVIVFE